MFASEANELKRLEAFKLKYRARRLRKLSRSQKRAWVKRRNKKMGRPRWKPIYNIPCELCSKSKPVHPCQYQRYRFCSRECTDTYMSIVNKTPLNKMVSVKCEREECNQHWLVTPGGVKGRNKYCSEECIKLSILERNPMMIEEKLKQEDAQHKRNIWLINTSSNSVETSEVVPVSNNSVESEIPKKPDHWNIWLLNEPL